MSTMNDPAGRETAGKAPTEQKDESSRSPLSLDRESYIEAIGPMGAIEDPDAFDRAVRSFGPEK